MIASSWARRQHWLMRSGLAALLALVALATWWSGALDALSVSHLTAERDHLSAIVAAQPVLAVLVYVLVFAILAGAALPVALALTLISGVLFGPWLGGAATAVGATGAATLTYGAARSSLGAFVKHSARTRPRLKKLVDGVKRRPFLLMLAVRLTPLFPFAPVNIAAGLASLPLRAYVAATLVGALPTSTAYAAIGAGLGEGLADPAALKAAMLSPAVLGPLVFLAVLGLTAMLVRPWIERRIAER